jgi:adenylate cyclase
MADIFMSYSSQDREKAVSLAGELRALGTSVWIDQAIDGASRWSSEIAKALDECKVLILLVSKSSLASRNCVKEVIIAAEADKQILPVDLEDIPLSHEFKYHLAGIQRVAYSNRVAIRRALEKLLSAKPLETRAVASLPVKKDNLIRLAVLPFSDLSPMHDNEWFADGMMDELISTLGSLNRMRVPSRMDVIHYKKNRPKIRQIARDLNVRYPIEGSVRKAGEKIRISASLIDSASDWLLWSQNFNGTFENIFDFQEETSKAIAEVLKLELTPEEEKILVKNPTDNPEAYQLYLKGLGHTARVTKGDFAIALSLFEEAIKLDPNFAQAYCEIAITCTETYRVYSRSPEWLTRAEAAIKRIHEIEGETAQYHLVASGIERLRGKLKDALYHAKRAVEIDSSFGIGYQSMGGLYHLLGDYRLAMESWEKGNTITT